MSLWHDFAHLAFLQRALLAGLLISGLCSVLSVYVIYQRLAFIGQGMSHAAFGGLALGLLVTGAASPNVTVYVITAIFAVAVASLIAEVTRASDLSQDTAIGIFLATSMALGLVLLSFRSSYTSQAFSFLFGSILAITRTDLYVLTTLALVVGALVAFLYKELFALSFDEEMASVTGVPVRLVRHMLLGMLAVTIVVSMKLVGAILISAFLVIPGATASLVATRFKPVMLWSAVFALSATLAGLVLSYLFNLPSGASIVLCQFALFVAAWCVSRIHRHN